MNTFTVRFIEEERPEGVLEGSVGFDRQGNEEDIPKVEDRCSRGATFRVRAHGQR